MASFFSNQTEFGRATVQGNDNTKVSGKYNEGQIANNPNLKLHSNNSKFQFLHNSNANVTVESSDLRCLNNTNLTLGGKKVKACLKNNTNANFKGDNSNWEGSFNSNTIVEGNDSTICLVQNSNTTIKGNGCKVDGKFNTGLNIIGDQSNVKIIRTQNHELKLAMPETVSMMEKILTWDDKRVTNKLEVSLKDKDQNVSSVSDTPSLLTSVGLKLGFATTPPSPTPKAEEGLKTSKFLVEYVNEAVIDEWSYTLGIFAFEITPRSATSRTFDVEVHDYNVDPKSMSVRVIDETEIRLSAKKDGKKQRLRLVGPSVKRLEGRKRMFTIETA